MNKSWIAAILILGLAMVSFGPKILIGMTLIIVGLSGVVFGSYMLVILGSRNRELIEYDPDKSIISNVLSTLKHYFVLTRSAIVSDINSIRVAIKRLIR